MIDEKDIRVEHVTFGSVEMQKNVTVIHIPTGIVTNCSEFMSRHKNRVKALQLLEDKLKEMNNNL